DYRFLDPSAKNDDTAASSLTPVSRISFKFLHDRVQQVAYSLLGGDERKMVHLRIGRLLHLALPADDPGDALFATVSHMNAGASLMDDPAERDKLVRLNLTAGRRAKANAAFQAAVGYLEAAMALLDEVSWEQSYTLSFALGTELIECLLAAEEFDKA